MSNKKIFFALAASLACAAPARSDTARYKIRFVIAHEPYAAYQRAAKKFGELVGKETKGAIAVEVLTPTQAGKGRKIEFVEAMDMVAAGEYEMGQAPYNLLARDYDQQLLVLGLPYLFRNDAHVDRVVEGPVGEELLAHLNTRTDKLEGLSFTYSGGIRVMAGHHAIHGKADFAGEK